MEQDTDSSVANLSEKSPWQQLINSLFGYDFFISYCWADGRKYAVELARELEARGYECFLDSDDYAKGDDWKLEGQRALENTSRLVLVGSPKALQSGPVLREVKIYTSRGLRVIPIDFDGSLDPKPDIDSSPVLDFINPEVLRISEQSCRLKRGPSAHVVEDIAKSLVKETQEQRRTRFFAIASIVFAIVAIVAISFWQSSEANFAEAEHQRDRARQALIDFKTSVAFRSLDREIEAASRGPIDPERVDAVEFAFRDLSLDPLMAIYLRATADFSDLDMQPICSVSDGVSFIVVSDDGERIFVAYYYQNFGGNPDIEDIPDWTSVAVLRISTGDWEINHLIGSELGRQFYGLHMSDVLAFDAPHHLVLKVTDGNKVNVSRVSLLDGTTESLDHYDPNNFTQSLNHTTVREQLSGVVAQRVSALLDPNNLYRTHPDDGIDAEYGPRRVDNVIVNSPIGLMMFVGTYEGRMILIDLKSGSVIGVSQSDTVYAAAYAPSGTVCYVADTSTLWAIDTSVKRSRVHDFKMDLSDESSAHESVLDLAILPDASILAVATTHRLACFVIAEQRWMQWPLPKPISNAAAFRIDGSRNVIQLVAGGDGTVCSVNYDSSNAALQSFNLPLMDQPVVAWFERGHQGMAWMAPIAVSGQTVTIRQVSLAQQRYSGESVVCELTIDSEENEMYERQPAVHAIARAGDSLLVFYGDSESFSDCGILSERLTTVSISAKVDDTSMVVFPAEMMVDGLGEPHWSCNHVERVLNAAHWSGVIASTNLRGLVRISEDGGSVPIGEKLVFQAYGDEPDVYNMQSFRIGDDVSLQVRHQRTGVQLEFELPWKYEEYPTFARISESGMQVLMANRSGDFMIFDVSSAKPADKRIDHYIRGDHSPEG